MAAFDELARQGVVSFAYVPFMDPDWSWSRARGEAFARRVRPFRLHWTLPAGMKRWYAWNLRLVLENFEASCTAKWRVALNGADVMAARVIGEKETIELPLASAALNWGGDNVLTLTTDDKGETVTSGIVIREVGLVMERPQSGTIMVLR